MHYTCFLGANLYFIFSGKDGIRGTDGAKGTIGQKGESGDYKFNLLLKLI